MKRDEFINKLAEFCEFSETDLTINTKIKSIEGYDSMAIMAMMAFVDENFDIRISATQINALSDFNSLINLIGKDKFKND